MNTGDHFRLLVDLYWASYGVDGTTTTFELRRRTTSGKSDLGTPQTTWSMQVVGQAATIWGSKLARRGLMGIPEEGRIIPHMMEMLTSYADIQPGDTVVLASDGLAYNVEKVGPEGVLRHVWLNSSRAGYHP